MYEISDHASIRYFERIYGYSADEAKRNSIISPEKVKSDINAMIEHGREIYTGKSVCKSNDRINTVVMCDLWVIIVDKEKNNVVTLYKISLGAGEDIDKLFVQNLLTQIDEASKKKGEVELEVLEQSEALRKEQLENEATMKMYRKTLRDLEERNKNIGILLQSEHTRVDVADNAIRDLIASLTQKKEF